MSYKRYQKAFTLIELLVVIAIIALLIAVLVPALKIAKEKAAAVVCLTNMNSMGKAWYTYTSDNDQEMVCGFTDRANYHWVNAPIRDDGSNVGYNASEVNEKINGIRQGALYPYLKNPKIYHCRSDKRSKTNPKKGGSGKGGYRSYSIAGGMNGHDWPYPAGTVLKKHTQLMSSESKYVFVEEMDGRGGNQGSWVLYFDQVKWIDPLAIWHNNASTFAYADGHADLHKWLGKGTIQMSIDQTFYYVPVSDQDKEDLVYMQKGYAHKDNR